MKNSRYQLAKGFTLIELLVVIAIIGILASVVLSSLNSARASARDSQRVQIAKQLQIALEMFYNNNGSYPSTGNTWRGGTVGCLGGFGFGANGYIPGLVPTYISVLPEDPRPQVGSNDYCLLFRSNGTDYKLVFFNTFEACSPGLCPLQDPQRTTTSVGRSGAIYTPGARTW
jgi:prepilin-type N-terminal cleavage/methylation domain-containing protein